MNLTGQLIGFAAVAISAVIYLQKDRKHILVTKLLTDVLWAIHHFLIGNTIAAITTVTAIAREILLIKKRRIVYLIIFPVLFFISLIFTYKNVTSLIPPLASSIATFGFYNNNLRLIKVFGVSASVLMLIYGACNNSVATVVNELIVLSSISVAEIKSKIEKHKYHTVKKELKNAKC
ncbi:MAG: YgjV family protein [Acutalibacteraceae bacterium]